MPQGTIALQEKVNKFNRKWNPGAIKKLNEASKNFEEISAELFELQLFVIGNGILYFITDETVRNFYLDQKNWGFLPDGIVFITKMIRNNNKLIRWIIMTCDEFANNPELFKMYDKKLKIQSKTDCDSLESFLIKYGPKVMDWKKTHRGGDDIINMFEAMMDFDSTMKKIYDLRVFTTKLPTTDQFNKVFFLCFLFMTHFFV